MVVNERINERIKRYIPKTTKPVHFIMKLLNISKKSAYRRLRNEIPYSVEETLKLISRLDIPIEEIFEDFNNNEKIYFTINTTDLIQPSENYAQMMRNRIKIIKSISDSEDSEVIYAGNKIPDSLALQYKMLGKLSYIRWIHQTHEFALDSKFSEIVVPDEIIELHKKYIETCRKINKCTGIFDYNIIITTINVIRFYYHRNLIEDNELLEMKNELHLFIDYLESMSYTGKASETINVSLYLSYLQIESNLVLFKSSRGMKVYLLTSGKNPIATDNVEICKDQKIWIESLLKFSSLVSRSNEILRVKLFQEQRQNVEKGLSLFNKTLS